MMNIHVLFDRYTASNIVRSKAALIAAFEEEDQMILAMLNKNEVVFHNTGLTIVGLVSACGYNNKHFDLWL